MKPFEQWTPEELMANLSAALDKAGVKELIGTLAIVSDFEGPLEEASRRRLIRLLAARLVLRTISPEYLKE